MALKGRGMQRGQALSELALLSVLLIIILLGAVDLARVFQFTSAMQEAAREGARHAAWYDTGSDKNPYLPTSQATTTEVNNQITAVLKGAGLTTQTITTTYGTCPASSGAAPTDSAHINAYVCLDSTAPTGVKCSTTNGGHDVEVYVAMQFSLIVQTNILGFAPNFPINGDQHMRVQGC